MLMISIFSAITTLLCIAFYCEINGGSCEKAMNAIIDKIKRADVKWDEMYNNGN